MDTYGKTISAECLAKLKAEGKLEKTRGLVYFTLCQCQSGCTREELSNKTGLRLSAVCGRARELLDMGIIEENGTRLNELTGMNNTILRVVKI